MKKLIVILISSLILFTGCSGEPDEPVETDKPVEESTTTNVETLDELVNLVGFTFQSAPESIDIAKQCIYTAYPDMQMAEVNWYDDSDKDNPQYYAFARKVPTEMLDEEVDSITGMDETFDEVRDVEGYKLSIIKNIVYMAEWVQGEYSYALVMLNGASEEVMLTLVKEIK